MTGTDNTYTYTHANSGNAVVITVTFEETAAAEAIVEKGNALANVFQGTTAMNSAAAQAAMSALAAAKTQAEAEAAVAALQEALEVPGKLVWTTEGVDAANIEERDALARGVLAAWERTTEPTHYTYTIMGTPTSGVFSNIPADDSDESFNKTDEGKALLKLWFGADTSAIAANKNILYTIGQAIKAGDSSFVPSALQSRGEVPVKMAYIPLPNGTEGYGEPNRDNACLVWMYANGDYGFDARYNTGSFTTDIENFKF